MTKPSDEKSLEVHVRLPRDVGEKLQRLAERECRSVCKQAEYLIRKAVESETLPPVPDKEG